MTEISILAAAGDGVRIWARLAHASFPRQDQRAAAERALFAHSAHVARPVAG
jgi:hypothetical protein